MKLLTKAWYQTMLDSGLGVQLRADKRAAEFSEAVYQQVWEEKLSEWLELRREVCDVFGETFDEAGERLHFQESQERELELLRTRVPGGILEKVADIRLMALGVCTEEVFAEMKAYREWCRKWTEKTQDEAWNMRCSQGLDKAWIGEHSLHDSVVLSLRREGEDLLIDFERDEDATWPEIKAVRFRDAEILKQEQPLEKAWWLYDEIWRTEEGDYEIHALLWRENEVFELTIRCRETELIWTVEPKAVTEETHF